MSKAKKLAQQKICESNRARKEAFKENYRRSLAAQESYLIRMDISDADIMDLMSPAGGFTRDALASVGVPWPPPKGWRMTLVNNYMHSVLARDSS